MLQWEGQTMARKPATPPPTATRGLTDKAFPIVLNFGLFGNSKKVQTSQIEVVKTNGDQTDTDKTMLRASKKLLDSPEYEAIRTSDGKFKEKIDALCLPFDIPGARLIPDRAYQYVIGLCDDYEQNIRPALVRAFLAVYDDYRTESRRRLGPLYNPANYPPVEVVAQKFYFNYRIVEIGTPGRLQDLDRAQFKKETEKNAAFMRNAAEEITAALRGMFAEMVARLRDSLTDEKTPGGKRRKLYDSTVEKLKEFMSTFDFRNINDDTELQALVDQMRGLMAGASIEALKTTDELRAKVRDGADAISKQLETMVTTTTARKFRLQDTTEQ